MFVLVRTKHQGTKCRRKRECIDGGNTYCYGHCDTELLVELARRAAHHGNGNKYRHENQRRSKDGRRYAFHGIVGSHVGRAIAHIETGLHGFDHNNGIIYHCTDSKHQSKQRQQIDGETCHRHKGKCADDGHQNADGRYEGGTDVLQEYVHDQYYQQNGFEQRMEHDLDGGFEKKVCIIQCNKLQSFGQILAYLFEHLVNLVDGFRCIGSGLLVNQRHGGRLSVHFGRIIVSLISQLDVRNFLQAEHLTAGQGADNQFAEFFGSGMTTAVFHRILESIVMVFSKRPGSRFNVLLLQYSSNIRRNELVLCHLIGFQPDAHTVIGTEKHHVSHTSDTFDSRLYINFHIVVQELKVIFAICGIKGKGFQFSVLLLHRCDPDFGHLGR